MSGPQTQEQSKKPVVNFSRPRFNSNGSGIVRSINAFHPTQRSTSPTLPTEPRFSIDSGDPTTEKIPLVSERESNPPSDLIWDDTRGELVPRKAGPLLIASDQRHPGPQRRQDSTASSSSASSASTAIYRPKSAPRPPTSSSTQPLKSILKHTTVSQHSSRASSPAGESLNSRHTVSDSGSGSVDKDGKWVSSDFDTSGLSEKELKKLEKKGINPALYAEMKSARKEGGKKCIGGLVGNAYVS